MAVRVARIDRHPVEVPFRPVPGRNLRRELPHWTHFDVVELELDDGTVGFGERMRYYTWHDATDMADDELVGRRAPELLWQDELGPGIQIALFDAVGRALDVPAHALLGERVRTEAPISWWCIDMPPDDLVAEAERAATSGYTALKFKGRPWFDLRAQLDALDAALPPEFDVDIDFNGTLLEADRARPLLDECRTYPQVSHFEEPIPPTDLDGNRRLCEALSIPIVHHYGAHDPASLIDAALCDGFVVSDGAHGVRDATAAASATGRPCWLQLVGTGITAAFSLQCAAVCEAAAWPAVNCHQIFESDLLATTIAVEDGMASVPEAPGLGHEIDRDAIARYRSRVPDERPNPPRLIETDWTDGGTLYLAEGATNFMLDLARDGAMPYFDRGVRTRLVPDDGTEAWGSLHERARSGPVWTDDPIHEG